METLDRMVLEAFTSFGFSVDRIATFRGIRGLFLALLPAEPRAAAGEDDLIWRLFQLRKSGRLPIHPTRSESA
jgi:hypothetical protein